MVESGQTEGEVDSVMNILGWRGRYQITQVGITLLCIFPTTFNLLSVVFIARDVPFRCFLPEVNASYARQFRGEDLGSRIDQPSSSIGRSGSGAQALPRDRSHHGQPGLTPSWRTGGSDISGGSLDAAAASFSVAADNDTFHKHPPLWDEAESGYNASRRFYLVNVDVDGEEKAYVTSNVTFQGCSVTVIVGGGNTGEEREITMDCPDGYVYSKPIDQSVVSAWDLVCGRSSLVATTQTVLTLGTALGALLFPALADRFGRHPLIFLCNLGILASSLGAVFAPNYVVFTVTRFFIGTFQQGVGLCSAVLLVESVITLKRVVPNVLGSFLWAFSMVLMAPLAYLLRDMSWRYTQGLMCATAAYCFIQYWATDESMRWLDANGKTKRMEKVLRRAAKMNGVDEVLVLNAYRQILAKRSSPIVKKGFAPIPAEDVESKMEELRNSVRLAEENNSKMAEEEDNRSKMLSKDQSAESEDVSSAKYTLLDIVRNKSLLLASVITSLQWMSHGLTYYGLHLTSDSLADDVYLGFFLNAIVELPSAVVFGLVVNRYGRKNSSMAFGSLSGVSLIASVVILTVTGGNPSWKPAVTACSLLGKFAVSTSWGVIFQYTPEIYPTNLRSAGIGVASMAARVGSLAAPYANTLSDVVEWGPGVLFGVSVLGSSLLIKLLPESTGHELPTRLAELQVWEKQRPDD